MKTQAAYLNKTLMILLSMGLIMSSCSKEDDSDPMPEPSPQQSTASTYPTPSDADGTLVAVKTSTLTDTPIGPIVTVLGTAVAVFSDDGFTSDSWISAGEVSCNANTLTINPNNSYVFDQITQTNPMGIDFNSGVDWSVSGANGIATFSHDASNLGFPGAGEITSANQIVKADGYTLTCDYTAGADSVIFVVGGTTKTIAGDATSCTFSAAELSDVNTGQNVVQIAPYVIAPTDFGDTRIYFVNELVISETVTVQ